MASHAYKVGDRVTIHNQTLSGKPIVEGQATVRKLVDHDDTYMVSFDGEREQFQRRVAAN